MIHPDKIQEAARRKENENFRFRTYLKRHADEKTLDRQFFYLHQQLFKNYDCSKCRNCCKMYRGSIPKEDLWRDARYLDITTEQFVDFFLEKDENGKDYQTKHMPCDFLLEDGNCRLGDYKPDSCKNFPNSNRPERLYSMLNMIDAASVCPVVFEMLERLKREYWQRRKR